MLPFHRGGVLHVAPITTAKVHEYLCVCLKQYPNTVTCKAEAFCNRHWSTRITERCASEHIHTDFCRKFHKGVKQKEIKTFMRNTKKREIHSIDITRYWLWYFSWLALITNAPYVKFNKYYSVKSHKNIC